MEILRWKDILVDVRKSVGSYFVLDLDEPPAALPRVGPDETCLITKGSAGCQIVLNLFDYDWYPLDRIVPHA